MIKEASLDYYYFECVRCGQTLRTTHDNPSSHAECGKCGYDEFHAISKAEYNASNGRFEVPK